MTLIERVEHGSRHEQDRKNAPRRRRVQRARRDRFDPPRTALRYRLPPALRRAMRTAGASGRSVAVVSAAAARGRFMM